MLRTTAVTCALMLCLGLSACKTTDTSPVMGGPLLSESKLSSLQSEYQQVDAGARVGQVIAALPEQKLVAVSGMPTSGILEGEHITFTDQQGNVIAIGSVVSVRSDSIHVEYSLPAASGSRAPEKGDIAIRFSK